MSNSAPYPDSNSATPPDARLGTTLDGNLTLRAVLGRGAMGVVYRAYQRSMDREVAVKVLDASAARDAPAVRRFLQEARTASRLSHPHVVTVFDFGQSADGQLYLMMELLDGHPLAAELGPGRRMAPERVVRILAQVCDATQHAHDHGLVHRDLKPENIFILDAGNLRGDFVKVLDFGIARTLDAGADGRITATGQVCGTPAYMSPEQALGGELDGRSDVYALGVIAYELLTGGLPFTDRAYAAVMRAHVREPVPPMTGVPSAIEAVVRQAMAKDRSARTASARAFADALAKALPSAGVQPLESRKPVARAADDGADRDAETRLGIVPDGALLVEGRAQRRRRRLVFGAAALFTLVVLGAFALLAASPAGSGSAGGVPADGAGSPALAAAPAASPPAAESPAAPAAESPAAPPAAAPGPPTPSPLAPSPLAPSALRVTTHPAGAAVRVDGRAVGTTPLELPRPNGDARVTLVIQRPGFVTERRVLDAGSEDVVVSLRRVAPRPPSASGSEGVIE